MQRAPAALPDDAPRDLGTDRSEIGPLASEALGRADTPRPRVDGPLRVP
jgi:hypothetical protein